MPPNIELNAAGTSIAGSFAAPSLTRVRTVRPDLPVLYVTGYATPSSRRKGLVSDALLLRKPYRPDELRFVVASLIERPQGSNR